MRLELYNGNILGDEFGPSFPYNVAITKKGIASPKSPIMQFDTTDTVSHATLNWPISGMIFKSYLPKQKKNHFALQRLLNENRLFQNLNFFFALRQIFGFRIMPNGCSGSSCLKMPDEKWSS